MKCLCVSRVVCGPWTRELSVVFWMHTRASACACATECSHFLPMVYFGNSLCRNFGNANSPPPRKAALPQNVCRFIIGRDRRTVERVTVHLPPHTQHNRACRNRQCPSI